MSAGKLLKRLLTRGKLPAPGLFGLRQAKFREEQFTELLGGADVERPLRFAVDVLGDAIQILLHFLQKTGEGFGVELDAALSMSASTG